MQETIDHTKPKNIFLSAYWPGQQAGEPHIGYGARKGFLIVQLAGLGYSVTSQIVNLFIAPKVRPTMKPVVRTLLPLAIATILGLLSYLYGRSNGYYQLDEQGNPVLFLSSTLPDTIKDRKGMNRQEFLEQTQNA